jgi:hypothetical protein
MSSAQHRGLTACALGLIGLLATGQSAAFGIVTATADMATGNLRFSFDDPNASLIWADDWFGTVIAYAQDTDSGADTDEDAYLGNDGFIDAEAQTGDVDSRATYESVDGANVSIDRNASVATTAFSALAIGGKHEHASGFAVADFDNFFLMTGGDPLGPPVEVTIELDYAGRLDATANEYAFFYLFTGVLMELYDVDDVTGDIVGADLVFDAVFDEAFGTNASYFNSLNGSLSITAEIPYDNVYWLYAQADSDVYGAVPVAGTLPMLLFGAGVLAWCRGRIRHET